jgi:hypothetical protein
MWRPIYDSLSSALNFAGDISPQTTGGADFATPKCYEEIRSSPKP